MQSTTTTDDPSVAPTATLPTADIAATSPAEAGRQLYTIREYRLDTIAGEPILMKEKMSRYLDSVYGDTTAQNCIIVCWPGEDRILEIFHCRTPMHAIAMLAALNAIEDDQRQESGA